MKSTLILTMANLRKNKGQSLFVFLFVLLSTIFFSIGLVLILEFGSFFDVKADEANLPHSIIQLSAETMTDDENWFKNHKDVIEFEQQRVLSGVWQVDMNGSTVGAQLVIADVDANQKMNPPKLIGESNPLNKDSVYLPYLMKVNGGFEIGDTYTFSKGEKELSLQIAGFTEELAFGSPMRTVYRFYLHHDLYNELYEEMESNQSVFYAVRLNDKSNASQFVKEYQKRQGEKMGSHSIFNSLVYEEIKLGSISFALIMAAIVIAFAVIILIVCLVVIRFSIDNNIMQDMKNIGALKAIGYQNKQIIGGAVLQYTVVVIIGSIIGIICSQFLLTPVAKLMELQSALIWEPKFNIVSSLLSFGTIVFTVLFMTIAATKKIRKLYPLIALRDGIKTHNFRKNYAPLDTSYGSLPTLFSVKNICQNLKQSVMFSVIITVVTFAAVFGLGLLYNFYIETDGFMKLVAGEIPTVVFICEGSETNEILECVEKHDEVRNAFTFTNSFYTLEDMNCLGMITNDFSKLEGEMLYDGRYPKYDNEIVIGGYLAKNTNKKIGDTVRLKVDGAITEYLVTGFISCINNYGNNFALTEEGIKRADNDYLPDQIYIYLNEDVDSFDYIDKARESEKGVLVALEMKELANAQLGSFSTIFVALSVVILTITCIVIAMVLYLVMKINITRQKREFGIQKALGFTSLQLMNQISLQYIVLILIGSVIGSVLGQISFSPMLTMVGQSMGAMQVNMSVPIAWIAIVFVGIVVLSYLIAMLVSMRIHKVSPYGLVSE